MWVTELQTFPYTTVSNRLYIPSSNAFKAKWRSQNVLVQKRNKQKKQENNEVKHRTFCRRRRAKSEPYQTRCGEIRNILGPLISKAYSFASRERWQFGGNATRGKTL